MKEGGKRTCHVDLFTGPFSTHGGKPLLVLTRKVGEEIIISDDIRVSVVAVRGDQVRLGIAAPRKTAVDRLEIHQRRIAQQRGAKPPPQGEAAV